MGTRTTARTQQGDVGGSEHHGVVRFAGIPFTAPADGTRRFRAPEPHDPWTGVRPATAPGPIAPQVDFFSVLLGAEPEPQSEDCLFLNVFTPAVDDAARPVMVWIHGGAFVLGSGTAPGYDGSALAARGDVVVVTVNYRLGALGYLHLAGLDDRFPGSGNLGVLDQIAALTWVGDNIAGFGGDPGNVTIFGESAGGMSVGTLLGAPGAAGLFHKAIPQSGASHNVSTAEAAAEVAARFLATAGVGSVDALLGLTSEQMVAAQQALSMGAFTDIDGQLGAGVGNGAALPFQPVVDGTVLPAKAIDLVREGSAAGIPVLTGTCRDEWRLFSFLDPTDLDADGLERRFSKLFPDGAAAAQLYRDALPGQTPKEQFGAAVTDAVFRQPMHQLAEALLANGSPVFTYLFTWESPAMGGGLGSCHALDVPFVFGDLRTGMGALLGDAPPATLSDAMQAAWLAFARTGDPSNEVMGAWPAFDTDRRPTVRLDEAVDVVDDPEGDRRTFWKDLA